MKYTEADVIGTAAWATLSGFMVGAVLTAIAAYLMVTA